MKLTELYKNKQNNFNSQDKNLKKEIVRLINAIPIDDHEINKIVLNLAAESKDLFEIETSYNVLTNLFESDDLDSQNNLTDDLDYDENILPKKNEDINLEEKLENKLKFDLTENIDFLNDLVTPNSHIFEITRQVELLKLLLKNSVFTDQMSDPENSQYFVALARYEHFFIILFKFLEDFYINRELIHDYFEHEPNYDLVSAIFQIAISRHFWLFSESLKTCLELDYELGELIAFKIEENINCEYEKIVYEVVNKHFRYKKFQSFLNDLSEEVQCGLEIFLTNTLFTLILTNSIDYIVFLDSNLISGVSDKSNNIKDDDFIDFLYATFFEHVFSKGFNESTLMLQDFIKMFPRFEILINSGYLNEEISDIFDFLLLNSLNQNFINFFVSLYNFNKKILKSVIISFDIEIIYEIFQQNNNHLFEENSLAFYFIKNMKKAKEFKK